MHSKDLSHQETDFAHALVTLVHADGSVQPEEEAAMARLLDGLDLESCAPRYRDAFSSLSREEAELAYEEFILVAACDGEVTGNEEACLARISASLKLSDGEALKLRAEADHLAKVVGAGGLAGVTTHGRGELIGELVETALPADEPHGVVGEILDALSPNSLAVGLAQDLTKNAATGAVVAG
ncbi:MAG: hypothetical protein KDA24_02935, partial [Deltaproteobacteria bacterium]|nr:hypothetical protein [Deltaproteobacteria bacterium]